MPPAKRSCWRTTKIFARTQKGSPHLLKTFANRSMRMPPTLTWRAAYFLEHTNYALNATARMTIETDQIDWIKLREESCKSGRTG